MPRTQKQLNALDANTRDQIGKEIQEFKAGASNIDFTKRHGVKGIYRLRVGDFRVFMERIEPDHFEVFEIRHK